MKPVRTHKLTPLAFAVGAALGLAQGTAMGQESEDEVQAPEIEEVVVTGSRLKRDTYTSISPLQVISGQSLSAVR